ncbi:lipopolysaccharide-binding protein-like [Patiria miniata]|uniref:Bactericidal permeability-increasing protein n=1 Tax=Patiria miniata TaxID=46514 RepID=A0A914B2X2_PATMI|nr:lipopolysaccharide-binding protein-like [Patiria miniata]
MVLKIVLFLLIAVCMGPSVKAWSYSSMAKATARPGFQARISQSGLNYLRDAGLAILKEEIKHLSIPDISGKANVPILGGIDYTISNMRITSFATSSATLTTQSGVGLVLRASGITVPSTGDWHYRNHWIIPIRDGGSFDASMSGASLDLTLRIGKDQAGRPTVSSTGSDCSFDAGRVHVTFHGGASWLYNMFSGSISNSIKGALNEQTCSMITREVNTDLQRQFSNLQTQAIIDQWAVIDYSFVTTPQFSGHVDTAHKGEVFLRDSPRKEAPYTVPVIPSDPDVSRHVFLWVTDYLFQTAANVYYEAGRFRFTVTQDNLPPGRYNLNTSSFLVSSTLPDVSQKYPNMLMQVNANATAPPAINFGEGQVNVSLKVDLDFFVTLPSKSLKYLFTLNSTISGSTLLSSDGRSIKWMTDSLRVAVALKRTAIGNIRMKPISEAVNALTSFYLIPWINDEGKKGFPLLDSPNIKLENTVLKQRKGFIKLAADIKFTSSA